MSGDIASDIRGTVVDVQHFSTHDGPGIRTTVFLKGCSLRCKWCCNPETISPKPELAYNLKLCIGEKECGRCLSACPEAALHVLDSDGKVRVNWDMCTNCSACIEVCPSKALYAYGEEMSVAQVLDEVEQDRDFYAESGGGITLSGGEALMQPAFSAALLAEARRRGIHTAIETAGNVPWRFMEQVLPHTDLVLHDYKSSDPRQHKHWTGADNVRILDNYQRAYTSFPDKPFIARIPVVTGVNDTIEHVRSVLNCIAPYSNVVQLELLPYHRFGGNKYGFLGRVYELEDFEPPTPETMQRMQAVIDEWFASHLISESLQGAEIGDYSPSTSGRAP